MIYKNVKRVKIKQKGEQYDTIVDNCSVTYDINISIDSEYKDIVIPSDRILMFIQYKDINEIIIHIK